MPQSSITPLASDQIAPSEAITVELIQPPDMPAVIRIAWPLQPTACDPQHFPDVAAQLTKLFAEAATTLAQIKARKRL